MKIRIAALIAVALLLQVIFINVMGEIKMNHMGKELEMLISDIPGDKTSLIWDGTSLEKVEDVMDDNTLIDGYGGEFQIEQKQTPMLRIRVRKDTGLLNDQSIQESSETSFVSENEERYLSIVCLKETWEEVQRRYELELQNKEAIPAKGTIENALVQEGFIQTVHSGIMIGETGFIKSKKLGVIQVCYGGKGNMTVIRQEALDMIRYIERKLR